MSVLVLAFADGEVHTITYEQYVDKNIFSGSFHRPVTVTSNLGYQLNIKYEGDDILSNWGRVSEAEIVKVTAPNTPLVKYVYTNSDKGRYITDLEGRQWGYSGVSNSTASADYAFDYSMTLPEDKSPIVEVKSGDSRFVETIYNHGKEYSYSFSGVSTCVGCSGSKAFEQIVIEGDEGYKRTLGISRNARSKSPNRLFVTSDTNALGETTRYGYAGGKIGSVIFPEGNKEIYIRSGYGNITEIKQHPKPGSDLPIRVQLAEYSTGTNSECSLNFKCFLPKSITDANGKKTDLVFNVDHGGLLTMTEPADANGLRRHTQHTYTKINGLVRLTQTSVCTLKDCAESMRQVTQYTYWENTKLPKTVTRTNGQGLLKQAVSYHYDSAGRLLSQDGPLAGQDDATFYRYDSVGRKTWSIGPADAEGLRKTQRIEYRPQDDQVQATRVGTLSAPESNSFTTLLSTTNSYNANGLLEKREQASGGSVYHVIYYGYDRANRLTCESIMMDPQDLNAQVRKGCWRGIKSSMGYNRVKKTEYDKASRVLSITEGFSTPSEGLASAYTYTENGLVKTIEDGNLNKTTYTYNGFDELSHTHYPDASYEAYSYDKNGNVLTERQRDGMTFRHSYDALNQRTLSLIPGESSINTKYDGIGRKVLLTREGQAKRYFYDALSRVTNEATNSRFMTHEYDIANRRVELKYPDNFVVKYNYDAASQLISVNGGRGEVLGRFKYTPLGQLKTIERGNGRISQLSYTPNLTLNRYEHVGLNTTTYKSNPARQIVSREVTNPAYQVALPNQQSQSYTVNKLNQYTDVGGDALTYDRKGNLTGYDGWRYSYNAHNRLETAQGAGQTIELSYTAQGQLYASKVNGLRQTYLYDGSQLVAEYGSTGELLRRYVHGVGSDAPLAWYEYEDDNDILFYHADERGSIISETSSTGKVEATHQYGPYGELLTDSPSRFRYTGQILIPNTQLYYYKARVYHPKLGRFMQTDPVGYEDQMNLYAYVGNDPMNNADPSGMICVPCAGAVVGAVMDIAAQGAVIALTDATISDFSVSSVAVSAVAGATGAGMASNIAKLGMAVKGAATGMNVVADMAVSSASILAKGGELTATGVAIDVIAGQTAGAAVGNAASKAASGSASQKVAANAANRAKRVGSKPNARRAQQNRVHSTAAAARQIPSEAAAVGGVVGSNGASNIAKTACQINGRSC